MDVFISWSGQRSEAVALALRDWLPKVIQSLRPWMSAADIEKGSRWSSDIAKSLEDCQVGLICLTLENLNAPWILFEAGALSKTLDGTYVIPLLFQFNPSQLEGPLTQFQAVKTEKEDIRGLMQTINRALGEGTLPENLLNDAFNMWWPSLERALQVVPEATVEPTPPRPEREILEEILSLVRGQSRQGAELLQLSFLSFEDDDADGNSEQPYPRRTITPRQLEILRLTSLGKNVKEISSELGISERSVKHYWSTLVALLGVRSRVEAVAKAFRSGLIS